MALRLHPIGQGPKKPYRDPYDNTYEENVNEEVWEINTNKLLKESLKESKQGFVGIEHYPLYMQGNIAWANKPKNKSKNKTNNQRIEQNRTPSTITNVSPIQYQQSPELTPLTTYAITPQNQYISMPNNSNTSNTSNSSNTSNTSKKRQQRRISRKNRKNSKSRKNRKTRTN
jgi:hypothetical protein